MSSYENLVMCISTAPAFQIKRLIPLEKQLRGLGPMSHNPSHIMARGGAFVFNRRVPARAREAFGSHQIWISLGGDREEAEELAEKLNEKLTRLWE